MEPLLSLTATNSSFSLNPFPSCLQTTTARRRFSISLVGVRRRRNDFVVSASSSKEEPKLNEWDLMELKFGRLLGEDPKLTLAKVMGKKLNPDATYLEIEKSFHKNKGKYTIEEIPLDWSKESLKTGSLNKTNNLVRPVPIKGQSSSDSLKGLNLLRPVPKKGVKFETSITPPKPLEIKRPKQPADGHSFVETAKTNVPNVILRKPTVYNEDDDEADKTPKLRIKPNLSLRMGIEQTKEKFSDMTLLRKPPQMNVSTDDVKEEEPDVFGLEANFDLKVQNEQTNDRSSAILLSKRPDSSKLHANLDEVQKPSIPASTVPANLDEVQKPLIPAIKVPANFDEVQKPSIPASTVPANLDEVQKPLIPASKVPANLDEVQKPLITASKVPANLNEVQKPLTTASNSRELLELVDGSSMTGLQPLDQSNMEFIGKDSVLTESSGIYEVDWSEKFSIEAALQGKPKRLDQSVKSLRVEEDVVENVESDVNFEVESFLETSPFKKSEDTDWTRAEDLVKRGEREEVELISCSTRGFVVSFGSLIGFLPYRNLAAKWKFLAFESWLRRKGLNPSTYKQSLGIIASYDASNRSSLPQSTEIFNAAKISGPLSPEMKLEELLSIYEQEKIRFLSSFVGQKIKVNLVMADRSSRRLIFSIRPKEKDELVEKKKSLMAKLSVGDVVKCCIKKITYFGIFVEVEGVPALVHQTEVSWDSTLDPSSYYKIGQIVEAKVHQLDFSLERIFLSLKGVTPDPLIEALESVVGDPNSLDGRLQAAEPDTEWTDVDALIKELQQTDGIQTVSKGRYFLSPGLAPTFQVYMSSLFENQYKLLARFGNKVQEVIVQTSLDKEEMKSAILTCTNRVE